MSGKLKPCPFCGNTGSGGIEEALHVSVMEHDWRDTSWSVQCDKCTATMGYCDSEEEAVDAWNTRPALDPATLEAEWLGQSVEHIGSEEYSVLGPAIVLAVDDQGHRPSAWIRYDRGDRSMYRSVDVCDLRNLAQEPRA